MRPPGDTVFRTDNSGKLLFQSGVGASALVIDGSNRVGIGTSSPNAALDVNGAMMLKSALSNASGRPTVGASRVAAEVGGYGSAGAANDDGFLRLSAGGGTTATSKSFIDLSGFSTVADMDKTLVFGTAGVERMRINNSGKVGIGISSPNAALDVNGALLLKGALTNASSRPAVGTSRVAGEISGYGSGGAANDDGFLRLSAGGGTSASIKSFIDLTAYSTVADMDRTLVFGTAGAERMRINSSGNVGIGNSSPSTMLHIGTGANAGPGGLLVNTGWINSANYAENRPFEVQVRGSTAVVVNTNSFVGIGTTTPGYPLTVNGGTTQSGMVGTYLNVGAFGGPVTHGSHSVSIYASGTIIAGNSVIAVSDQRVKAILGRSNSAADLATLMQVEITDYRYKDVVAKGNAPAKKVIAQQVEKIFPQAVRQVTDVIPDIYQPAKTEGDWIVLETDLKPADRVKLVTDDGDKIYDVAEVRSGRFRTTERPKGEQIFVYGREVKDFRAVDYDAISMLNVSATQELARENADLKKRVTELEAKDRARDAKLASIEKLLRANQTVMAAPTKTANNHGQE